MENSIKLISIDLDGTLLRSDGSVDNETIRILVEAREKNFILVFNTARPFKMVPKELYNLFRDDYWVLSNGTTCLHLGKVFFHETIKPECSRKLIRKLVQQCTNHFFSVESEGNIFTCYHCPETNERYYAEKTTISHLEEMEVTKVIFVCEERDFAVDQITSILPSCTRLLTTEHGKYVQIMPKNVSKLSGVTNILRHHAFDMNHVLSFGDDLNDLEIIQASFMGVAMENAVAQLKQYSKYITLSNNDNGVGHFLQRLFNHQIEIQ